MRQYFVMLRGRRVGPYSQSDIVRAVEAGRIEPTSEVIDEVTGETFPASELASRAELYAQLEPAAHTPSTVAQPETASPRQHIGAKDPPASGVKASPTVSKTWAKMLPPNTVGFVRFLCPHCNEPGRAPADWREEEVTCGLCRRNFWLPESSASVPSTPAYGAAPNKSWYARQSANVQGIVFFGTIGAFALICFSVWAMQSEQKRVTYAGEASREVDWALREGWKVVDSESVPKTGVISSTGRYWGDELVTTVTLERSNWSKLWND